MESTDRPHIARTPTVQTRPAACTGTALAEPLPGTAPHRPVWALVEHPGPWGRDAPLDAPWPDGVGAALARATDDAGVRLVLARRHRTRPVGGAPRRPHVVLAVTGPTGWAGARRLDAAHDLLGLDWAALAGSPARPDGFGDPGPVWAVCTQGTRDACCARLGRPLAQAFSARDPESVWEISHSGGHRFAGVVLALPEGLCYGRVGVDDVERLVTARAAGEVVPDLLRGRMHLTPAQQAAEAALVEWLADPRLDAVVPDGLQVCGADLGAAVVRTRWRDRAGGRWTVEVTERSIADRPASCGKPAEPASGWVAAAPAAG